MNKNYKISLIIIGLLVFGGGLYYFVYYLPRVNYIKQNNIPANFLLKGLDFEFYQAQNSENLPVKSNEQIRPGVKYFLEGNGDEAIKSIMKIAEGKGWVAIAGSNREGNNATIKIAKNKDNLLIQVVEQNAFTEINIFSVQK